MQNIAGLSANYLRTIPQSREADEFIGGRADPYMERWFLNRTRQPHEAKIYLHRFHRSDDDRALHDHPGDSVAFMVDGPYREWRFQDDVPGNPLVPRLILPGSVTFRPAHLAHRIELLPEVTTPPLTVFIMSPKLREWGFHCPQGWRHHLDFAAVFGKDNVVGRGCD